MGTINFLEQSYKINNTNAVVEKLNIEQINDIIEKTTNEVVSKHSDVIRQIKEKSVKQHVLESKIIDIIDENNFIVEGITREELLKRVMDEVFGYSIIQKYIEDPEVNDIMVNSDNAIFIRKNQTDIKVPEVFKSKEAYTQFLYKVCAFCGQKLNESSPRVDGTDDNYGLRINITIAPINTYASSLIIRKGHKHFNLGSIVSQGNIHTDMFDTFRVMSKVGSRVMFAGQLESGKTTLMSSYLNLINKRMVIMEDTPEIITTNPNAVYQKTVNATSEEGIRVTLADLVKNFRRTNAHMPVVGEVRGPEAVELLDLFNTGFTCGACSIHANSAMDAVNQLIFQVKASGKLGVDRSELEEYIGRSIDMIVYMEKRKVVEMVELDYDYKKRELVFTPLHQFIIEEETQDGIQGHFETCINPYTKKMKDRIRRAGMTKEINPVMMQ